MYDTGNTFIACMAEQEYKLGTIDEKYYKTAPDGKRYIPLGWQDEAEKSQQRHLRMTRPETKEKPYWERTSQEHADYFERKHGGDFRGRVVLENSDGTLTYLRAYTATFDPKMTPELQQRMLNSHSKQFALDAAQAGYELATAPIVIQDGWRSRDGELHPRLWLLLREMSNTTPHVPTKEWKDYRRREPTRDMGEPLVLSRGEDKALNWQEPTKALSYLLNQSSYSEKLRGIER